MYYAVSVTRIHLLLQDEGTFSLGNNGRDALKALGSRLSSEWCLCIVYTNRIHQIPFVSHSIASLSWRDMWAFVTVKGGEVIGEDVGKSVDVHSWGMPVTLHVTLPLTDSGGLAYFIPHTVALTGTYTHPSQLWSVIGQTPQKTIEGGLSVLGMRDMGPSVTVPTPSPSPSKLPR